MLSVDFYTYIEYYTSLGFSSHDLISLFAIIVLYRNELDYFHYLLSIFF